MPEATARLEELMKQHFPDWQIMEKLGEGSFASVYKIRCASDGKTAALKWISYTETDAVASMQSMGVNADAIRNYCRHTQRLLENEIKTMERLDDCPNIVRMDRYFTAEHEDGSFDMLMRMELLKPLPRRIPEMRVKDVLDMGKDICRALNACEAENVVHRDIKPENIFCDASGNFKLGDFGVATLLYGDRKTKTQRGTPLYMAPEVYEGKPYDARVDICSLGLVLYECLNWCLPPFMSDDGTTVTPEREKEALEKRMSDEEEMSAPAQADAEITAIIQKACAYDPEERYQNAKEMLEALEKLPEKPEYEHKLRLYTDTVTEEKTEQDPAETIKGLPRDTLDLSQKIVGGAVTDNDRPDDTDDETDSDTVEEQNGNTHVPKENPFEIKRQQKKTRNRKIMTVGGCVLAVALIICAVVLICLNKAAYTNLKAENNGFYSHVIWENGGSGPWKVRMKINDAVAAETVTDKREADILLAPGFSYTAEVDGKVSVNFDVAEKEAYSGEMNTRWLRLCNYTVQPDKALSDQTVSECMFVTADPLIGEPGQTGYMLKGCVELPAGRNADMLCFMVSDHGMDAVSFTVEGTDDGFRFFYIDLNEFIRKKCPDSEKLTLKIYANDMLVNSKPVEIH